MDRKVYIVSNYDICNSIAVKLTDEQASAISWFIEWADVDFGIDTPENAAEDIS